MTAESIDGNRGAFDGDATSSKELLDLIQQCNRQELDRPGFTTHFIDALKDVNDLKPDAKIVVKQEFIAKTGVRTVLAVLRQEVKNIERSCVRPVGQEVHGIRIPEAPFDDEDLDLAIRQLDDLQTMKNFGMIAIDSSLSWPESL